VYLQPELKRLLERLNDFINVAHLFNPTSTKRVFRIAATDNPAAILAPDLIPAFEAQAPAGKFAFTVPDKLRIVELLESGEVDLFIGAAEDGSDGLIGQKLFEEEFITAQRRGHPRGSGPLSLDEFCNLNHLLVSTSGGKFSGLIDDVLAELGRERNVSVSIQSYALAPLMLSSTDLICTLPRRFLERFSAILELTETPFPIAPFSMNIFWHPRSRTDPAHLWFRKLVMHSGRGHAVPTATI
jgi:DNA-binding transcriptional LysR family regulator